MCCCCHRLSVFILTHLLLLLPPRPRSGLRFLRGLACSTCTAGWNQGSIGKDGPKHWITFKKKKKNCVYFAKPHCMFFQQQVCHPRDITFRLMLQVNSEHYPTNGAISQAKFSHIWPHHLIKLVAGDWKGGGRMIVVGVG